MTQVELAKRLGLLPSRIVVLIDELTSKGLAIRLRSQKDRRRSEIVLAPAGVAMLEELSKIAREHEKILCDGLSKDERSALTLLLRKIAARHGLAEGQHPSFRK